mgnify:FL=1
MSASREKKQRQNTGPSDKSVKIQQEQAAQKRQTIVYAVVGGITAVLVAALLIWNSGFFQTRAVAATLGDETLTTAELSYYYHNVRSTYAQMGVYVGFDTSKSDDEQLQSENKTYRDFFLESALDDAQKYLALANEAVKSGHTEDEIKDQLDATISSFKAQATANGYSYNAYLRAIFGPYMTSDTLEKMVSRSLMAQLASSEKGTELYDGYQQSDLDAYYEENGDTLDTIEYSFLYFAIPSVDTKDEDGKEFTEDEVNKLKEEAAAETKKKAEEALKAVEDGAEFHAQADQYELTSDSNHGDHVKAVGTSSISSAFSEQLLKLGKDQCELVETDNGYYVISFHARYLDEEPTRDVRHIAIQAETTTGEDGKAVAPTDEAWAAAKDKIDAIQAEYEAGDKSEDAFADLANAKSEDGDGTTGGLYARVASGDTHLAPEFLAWIYEDGRAAGDYGIIRHSAADTDSNKYWAYHLMYYVGENEPVWMGSARSALANAALTEWMEGLVANYPAAQAGGASYLGK